MKEGSSKTQWNRRYLPQDPEDYISTTRANRNIFPPSSRTRKRLEGTTQTIHLATTSSIIFLLLLLIFCLMVIVCPAWAQDPEGNRWQRREAIRNLGVKKDREGVSELIHSLKNDRDDNVRAFAALSLGKIKDKSSVGALIEALNDERLVVKIEAIRALGEIGESQAIPTLLPLMENSNPRLRYEVASCLGKLGNKEGLDALLEEIENVESPLRVEAILALRDIGDDSTAILNILRDLKYDENERIVAAAKLVLEYFGEE
ncbi:HEAT repeat domain-containing protein [bacterium]|nr:HEAT repeat domain-containing protein [bacterium]